MRILTILPKSWSIARIVNEFGCSHYMARYAKTMVEEKGVLSSPNPKHGKHLLQHTEEMIHSFYCSDDVSRMMPGRKDYVSVLKADGKREHLQKRLVLCNLKEVYEQFKTLHPETKVGFSKFCELRPRECVLAGASGTHSVCVCTIHQNVKLMFVGCNLDLLSSGEFTHYRHCLAAMQCNPPTVDCCMARCNQCPGMDMLKENLQSNMDSLLIDTIQFKQWTLTDRSNLETKVLPTDEFLDTFMASLRKLQVHDFIAKMQAMFVTEAKDCLKNNEFLVIGDVSENFTFICQDAIQSFHWTNAIHPFICYYQNAENKLLSECFLIISECTYHDTTAVHLFQKKLIHFLTTTFLRIPDKMIYASDGCSAQYKNKKNFINLCHHMKDFGVQAEWHFFATSHGKTAADGAAGTLKRLATKASLQRPFNNHILSAKQLYEFAVAEVKGMHFCYATNAEHEEEARVLKERYDASRTIARTHKLHSFKPVSCDIIEVKEFSKCITSYCKRVMSKTA